MSSKHSSTRRAFFRLASAPVIVGAATAIGFHQSAHALFGSGIVFDPTNYVKNSMTAIQQYIDTANGYVQMAQDIRQTARKIGDVTIGDLSLNTKEGQQLMEFINSGKSVYGALKKTQQIREDMQRVFAASKYVTWEDFIKGIGERKKHGERLATSLYEAANMADQQLKSTHEQHMKVVGQMRNIEGVTDAAVATAQSVGVIIQQNQGMMQLMSQSARVQGQEIERQAMEREQADEFKKNYIKSAKESAERERALLREATK